MKNKLLCIPDIILDDMRKKGHRVTAQRKALIELLLLKSHLSVEEMINHLSKKAKLSRATIYNNVNALVEQGYLFETTIKDHKIYCLMYGDHYHIKCNHCDYFEAKTGNIRTLLRELSFEKASNCCLQITLNKQSCPKCRESKKHSS